MYSVHSAGNVLPQEQFPYIIYNTVNLSLPAVFLSHFTMSEGYPMGPVGLHSFQLRVGMLRVL